MVDLESRQAVIASYIMIFPQYVVIRYMTILNAPRPLLYYDVSSAPCSTCLLNCSPQTAAAPHGPGAGGGGGPEAEGGGGGRAAGGLRGGGEGAAGGRPAAGGEGAVQAGQGGGAAARRGARPEGLAVRPRAAAARPGAAQAARAARQGAHRGQEGLVQDHQDPAGIHGGAREGGFSPFHSHKLCPLNLDLNDLVSFILLR